MGFPGDTVVKNLPANAGGAGDMGSIPGLGRSPGEGNGNSLRYSCLENSMDRGAWWAVVHGATKCGTRLSTHTHTFIEPQVGGAVLGPVETRVKRTSKNPALTELTFQWREVSGAEMEQDTMVLAPRVLCLPFVCGKTLAK